MAKRLVTLTRSFDSREVVLNFDQVVHLMRNFAQDGVTPIGTIIGTTADVITVTESLEEVIDLAEKAN